MPTHDVMITGIPRLLIGGNDVVLEIREGQNKLGDLKISQGNLHWVPVGCVYGYTLGWSQLDRIAKEQGRREKYTC